MAKPGFTVEMLQLNFWCTCGCHWCFGPHGYIGLYSLDCYKQNDSKYMWDYSLLEWREGPKCRECQITSFGYQFKITSVIFVVPGNGIYCRKDENCSFLLTYRVFV